MEIVNRPITESEQALLDDLDCMTDWNRKEIAIAKLFIRHNGRKPKNPWEAYEWFNSQ